jgi:hypothetical protein
MFLVRAGATFVAGFARAGDGGEASIDQTDDVAHADLAKRFGDSVTAGFAASGVNVSGAAELEENLFDELEGESFCVGEFCDGDEGPSEGMGDAEPDESTEGILAALGKIHAEELLAESLLAKYNLERVGRFKRNPLRRNRLHAAQMHFDAMPRTGLRTKTATISLQNRSNRRPLRVIPPRSSVSREAAILLERMFERRAGCVIVGP